MKRILVTLILALLVPGICFASGTKADLTKRVRPKVYRTLNIDEERAVLLEGPIYQGKVDGLIDQISELDAMNNKPIYMVINSPGGSVIAGFSLIRVMESIKSPIVCAVDSEAFSMAAIIAMYCSKTYMHKFSAIMFHQAAYGVRGEAERVKTRVRFIQSYLDDLEEDTARRMGLTLKQLKDKSRGEWWMTAKEAAGLGVVDGVLNKLHYRIDPPDSGVTFRIFGEYNNENVITHPLDVEEAVKDGPK